MQGRHPRPAAAKLLRDFRPLKTEVFGAQAQKVLGLRAGRWELASGILSTALTVKAESHLSLQSVALPAKKTQLGIMKDGFQLPEPERLGGSSNGFAAEAPSFLSCFLPRPGLCSLPTAARSRPGRLPDARPQRWVSAPQPTDRTPGFWNTQGF